MQLSRVEQSQILSERVAFFSPAWQGFRVFKGLALGLAPWRHGEAPESEPTLESSPESQSPAAWETCHFNPLCYTHL